MIKLFKLTQMAMEYLISIHYKLDSNGKEFINKQKKYYEENLSLRDSLLELDKELTLLKSEYVEKQKSIQTYELLLKQPGSAAIMNKVVTRANAISCEFCKKAFISFEFLEEHKKRRHLNTSVNESNSTKDIAPILEIFKSFTEQRIQTVTESHKRELESLKELMKLQLEIQKDHENSSFQKLLLMQSQQINAHEDIYSKLLIETQFEKEKLTQIITEDLKKIEERDKILKSLRETNESLAKDLEKDSYSHEFISRTNSISDNIDVIDQPYRLDSSELEMKKVDLRLETTLPEQLIENIYQDIEESQIKYKKKSKTLNIEKIDEEKENSLVSDKKNFENKQFGKEKNVEILPNKLIVSNAGEIEDDSDVEDEKDNFGSNAGEIYSDSDKSLEKNESFEAYESVSKEVEIPYDTKDFSEEIQILTGNTQKFDPKAMKEYEETEEFEEQTTAVQQVKNQSSEYSREQIAKMIGINPKIHQNYLYLVDNFLNFSLSAS